MTARKGMLWKTPWRRRTGGLVNQPPVEMWFFDLSGAVSPATDSWEFISPAAVPTFAAGPGPFWLGLVCRVTDVPNPTVGATEQGFLRQFSSPPSAGVFLRVTANRTTTYAPGDTENADVTATSVGFFGLVRSFLPRPGLGGQGVLLNYDWSCVTVALVQITPQGGTTLLDAWLDNVYLGQQSHATAYAPANTSIRLGGGRYTVNGPTLHGAVGGTGLLTASQVETWFQQVKSGAQIVGIPGQTTDLWSAAAVQPLVPNPLPNLAGGQNLNLTAFGTPIGPPSNVLVPVSFNY